MVSTKRIVSIDFQDSFPWIVYGGNPTSNELPLKEFDFINKIQFSDMISN